MYNEFQWTPASGERNRILRSLEPLQPYLLMDLACQAGATVFVDVGANIGAYSLFFSKLEGMSSIYAFEPSPLTFTELNRNVALNELGGRIGRDKSAAVRRTGADLVVTANPGCAMQIGAWLRLEGSRARVAHLVEVLDESYRRAGYYP